MVWHRLMALMSPVHITLGANSPCCHLSWSTHESLKTGWLTSCCVPCLTHTHHEKARWEGKPLPSGGPATGRGDTLRFHSSEVPLPYSKHSPSSTVFPRRCPAWGEQEAKPSEVGDRLLGQADSGQSLCAEGPPAAGRPLATLHLVSGKGRLPLDSHPTVCTSCSAPSGSKVVGLESPKAWAPWLWQAGSSQEAQQVGKEPHPDTTVPGRD
jgi:hypothetical protein